VSIADELLKLDSLRASGSITDHEYARAKAHLLDGAPSTSAPRPPAGAVDPGSEANLLQRLARSSRDRWLGGICGGLGLYTPIPSWTWGLIFCAMLLFYGIGLVPYILLWIFVPSDRAAD
jgi:phage shock protein PspC (stress-responsive transcriptional regulator)